MGTSSSSTAYRQRDNATESSSGQGTSSMLLGANFHGCTVCYADSLTNRCLSRLLLKSLFCDVM